MALEAGVMTITIEFAQGLKDKDFFGKMDPYAIITVGSQTYRTKTVKSGGTNPVFNETFRFNVINENDFHLVLKDEDVTEDELIGTGRGDMARCRQAKTDRIQVPMQSKSGKQHGFVSLGLKFEPNNAGAGAGGAPQPYGAPHQQYAPPPQYAYPPPGAHAPYSYPGGYAPPPGAFAPPPYPYPAPGGYPAPGAPQAYPPQQYPPQQYPPQQYPPQQYPPQQYPPAPGSYTGYPPR